MAKDVRQDLDAEQEQLGRLDDGSLSRTVLRNIAIGATSPTWAFCPKCRERVRTDAKDTGAMVNAAKALAGADDQPLDTSLDPANLTPPQRTQLQLRTEAILGARAHGDALARAHTREEEAAGQV